MTYQELLQKYPKDQIRKAMILMKQKYTKEQNQKKAEQMRQLRQIVGML